MKDTYRRRAFVSSVVILTLVACLSFSSGPARAQKTFRLRVGIIPITEMLTIYVAADKGYFAQEGLEVEMIPMAGGAVILPALVGGSIDIAYSNIVSIILAKAEGMPLKIIMHNKSEDSTKAPDAPGGYKGGSAIMVRANSDIRSAKDIEGRKFAVNTLYGINWLFAQEWMRIEGADPAKAKWLEIPFQNMAVALETGQVDAVTAADPTLTVLKTTGKGKILNYYFSTVKANVIVASFVATDKWIKEQPGVMQKFVRAMSRAIDYANTHENEWPTILAKHLKIELDLLKKMEGGHRFEAKVNMENLDWYVNVLVKRGLLKKRIDPNSLVSAVGGGS
ncbi:MAG: ABC transporter substrate-binding protein [Deltaproteobacteria bacterium]|nr:ABC transporter substrate-binding protein [Deltaproteobacteria bacterium]